MQVLAGDARGRDRCANGLFIAVHFRGVEMPVAQRNRAFNRGAAGIALQAKGAKPKPRQGNALLFADFPLNAPKKV